MKNKRNFILIVILTILVLYIVLKDNFTEKLHYLLSFNPKWLIISILLILVYWFLKGIVLYLLTVKINKKYKPWQGIHLMLNTQFFHAITPFAAGGQPYQIYKLNKQGLNLGESTNIVTCDFIVYQIALVLLGLIAVTANQILNIFPANNLLKQLVTIGFIINVLVIIFLFVIAFSKINIKKIVNKFINLFYKIKIIKDKEKAQKKSEEFVKNFHNGAVILMNNKLNFIVTIILNFLALATLYLIPFVLMKGLSINMNPFITVITSAYVMLIGSVVPIPGGTGGLEYGFIAFFGNFIKGTKLTIIMIVWRLVTYYFGIIVGAFTLNIREGKK